MYSNILFVDDESEIIQNYIKLFENKEKSKSDGLADELFGESNNSSKEQDQYKTYTASQGEEAVSIVKQQLEKRDPIQIAFVDMRMPPGIDGGETAARIRELDPKVEIVIVTAYSDINLSDLITKINRPDKLLYLKKPFSTDEIIQIANNLTEKCHLERSQELFLGNVSHELKTPLSAVLGFSKLLLEEDCLNDECRDMAARVYRNAETMQMLISDLIDTALLGEKRVILDVREFSVSDLVKRLKEEFQESKYSSRLIITEKCETVTCKGDILRVIQCLNHLVVNAMKFSEKEVELQISPKDSKVQYTVTDKGIGIDTQYHRSVFRRFFRVENEHHDFEGMGLGLPITKNLVELHGGSLELKSEIGVGTSISIII